MALILLTRPRIDIKVYLYPHSVSIQFLCSTAYFDNQRVMENLAETWQKSVCDVWRICYKALILHPQSREMRNEVEILNEDGDLSLTG